MREIEIEGRTVTMAVEKGLSDLGLRRDQVEVQVLEEGNPGFLGIGAKPAKVRIREKIWGDAAAAEAAAPPPRQDEGRPSRPPQRAPRPAGRPPESRPAGSTTGRHAPPDRGPGPAAPRPGAEPERPRRGSRPPPRGGGRPYSPRPSGPTVIPTAPPDTEAACAAARKVLEEVLPLVGLSSPAVKAGWEAEQVRVRAEVESPDAAILTAGEEGRALESLQYLVTLITSRRLQHPVAVLVEIGDYWHQKEEEILLQVHQAMEMVKRTGGPVRLKPMDAVMRRLVHRTLVNHPEFETVSEGEGSWRKVVLKPRRRR